MNILDKLRTEGKLGWPKGTRVTFPYGVGTIYDIYQDYKKYAIVTDDLVFFAWENFADVCKIQTAELNLEIIEKYNNDRITLRN